MKNNALGLWLQGGNSDEWWGLDYKLLQKDNTINAYLRFPTSSENIAMALYGGYYFLYPRMIKVDASSGKFPVYIGPTAGIGYWKNDKYSGGLAFRVGVTGGISWIFPEDTAPIDVSFELNPAWELHHSYWENGSNNPWEIPLYFRFLIHAYLF